MVDGNGAEEFMCEETAPTSPLVAPHALYQAAAIDISLVEERLSGHTTLWLAFPEELQVAATFALHCRVSVTDVLINGVPAAFDHRDPLTRLYPEQQTHSYSTAEIDARFRGALELGVLIRALRRTRRSQPDHAYGDLLTDVASGYWLGVSSLIQLIVAQLPVTPSRSHGETHER